jgi:hypothetical protein
MRLTNQLAYVSNGTNQRTMALQLRIAAPLVALALAAACAALRSNLNYGIGVLGQGSDRAFHSTTISGGPAGQGTVFSLRVPPP